MRLLAIRWLFVGMFLWAGICSLPAQNDDYFVLIKTNIGNLRVKLYNQTPEHRKEFLKLVNDQHFDGTLFYRVIKKFVIQGGSVDSRNAPPGKHIGYGAAARNIDSEFSKDLFHKKGALCAPRQPEKINEFKMSDISQFYIVQGRVWTNEELDIMEKNHNNPILAHLKQKYYVPQKKKLAQLKKENPAGFNALLRAIKDKINFDYNLADRLEFSEAQRKAYTTVGGLPLLDGEYTVFGQVVSGMEIIDQIAALKTDDNDRPVRDVTIKVEEVY